MYVFRLHIRPQGGSADMQTTFDYCLKNQLLGVGWRLGPDVASADWQTYLQEASRRYGDLQVCKYMKKWVAEGDLVWTRDTAGQYYLARVVSGWEYCVLAEAMEKDIDIGNIFRVRFVAVPIDAVPGKVVACFRPARTMQEIADARAIEYSKHLWNSLSGEAAYAVDAGLYSDLFMMLDDEETEDAVFLYLQSQGWYVVPNSRKADTMSFEFVAVHPATGARAISQVKTGNVVLNRDDYAAYSQQVFLFQSNGLYRGGAHDNVTCITREEMLAFLERAAAWLPDTFRRRMALLQAPAAIAA